MWKKESWTHIGTPQTDLFLGLGVFVLLSEKWSDVQKEGYNLHDVQFISVPDY